MELDHLNQRVTRALRELAVPVFGHEPEADVSVSERIIADLARALGAEGLSSGALAGVAVLVAEPKVRTVKRTGNALDVTGLISVIVVENSVLNNTGKGAGEWALEAVKLLHQWTPDGRAMLALEDWQSLGNYDPITGEAMEGRNTIQVEFTIPLLMPVAAKTAVPMVLRDGQGVSLGAHEGRVYWTTQPGTLPRDDCAELTGDLSGSGLGVIWVAAKAAGKGWSQTLAVG